MRQFARSPIYQLNMIWLSLCLVLLSACGAPGTNTSAGRTGTPTATRQPAAPTSTAAPTNEPTIAPTNEPTAAPTQTTASTALTYLWPTVLPEPVVIDPGQSQGDETGFYLNLADKTGGQFFGAIYGGGFVPSTPSGQGQAAMVTIRGQKTMAYTTGAGFAVFWQENGQPYAITGGLSLDMVIAVANGLKPLDLQAWRDQLRAGSLMPGAPTDAVPTSACDKRGTKKFDVEHNIGFCVMWADEYSDELGFQIVIEYGGGERFTYNLDPNTQSFVVPAADATRLSESAELCQRRGSYSVTLNVQRPNGLELVNGMAVDSECGMALPPAVPQPTPEPAGAELDPKLADLGARLTTLVDEWAGKHAVSVTDLKTGQTISVNGAQPQLAACTVKIVIVMAVAQDIESGRYSEADVAALVESAMGPSNTWPARELLMRIGDDDIGAGVRRVNEIMTQLGAKNSILTHPPGYPQEEYGYKASHGIDENLLTTDDLNVILSKLYGGEALSKWATEYVLHSMTIAPDWMDLPIRSSVPLPAMVYHKIGQLYEPENVWNDAAIITFEQNDEQSAYAVSYLGSYSSGWREAFAHETEIMQMVWNTVGG